MTVREAMNVSEMFDAAALVFGSGIDQCPECGHTWTDEAECHYNDCRYFVLDQEATTEDNE